MEKKTIIKIGEITIESDGSVDIEIDGDVIRIKGKQQLAPIVINQPYRDTYTPYVPNTTPWIIPNTPGPTWISSPHITCDVKTTTNAKGDSYTFMPRGTSSNVYKATGKEQISFT
jgi:hypothetical protein